MSFLRGMDISSSALSAQRLKMDVIADNVANLDTVKYKRKQVVFRQAPGEFGDVVADLLTGPGAADHYAGRGVEVAEIAEDESLGDLLYDPTHPSADENGYVETSNVDMTTEIVEMISAYRSYEANVTAFNAYKDMAVKALEIGL
jgi:flagellar basal-body rod protein FlgC